MSDEMTGMFKLQTVGESRLELRVARENFGIKRGERDVVVGQREAAAGREEVVG